MARSDNTPIQLPLQDHDRFLIIDHLTRKEIAWLFSRLIVNRETGCWEWRLKPANGYGRTWFRGRSEMMHRIIYAWAVGPLPRGSGRDVPELDHVVCNNRRCANPAHVLLTSHKANTLRSDTSPTAINSRRTHCEKGHPFPPEPNRWDGGRRCEECNRDYQREWARQPEIRERKKTQEWKDHRNEVRRALEARKREVRARSHQSDSA